MPGEDNPPQPVSRDIRPVVAPLSTNRSVLVFAGVATLAAGLLFYTLESRRASSMVADIAVPVAGPGDIIASPPPLALPEDYEAYAPNFPGPRLLLQREDRGPDRTVAVASRNPASVAEAPSLPITSAASRAPAFGSSDPDLAQAATPQPAVVFNAAPASPPSSSDQEGATNGAERVTATRFKNPSTTIPKGTVIQAVMETALDSTRAGFARAIVSRDTFGFDGTQILVPRGSRLVGEYKADLVSGQARALIQWQLLMRPDGVTIHLNSPAADPLGRAGVEGKVNSHFLERFSGAILQSALSIGVELATRRVSQNSVIVAVPGSIQGVAPIQTDRVQPTLKVRQGTSVSVFVSRDLDFSAVSQ